MKFEIFPADIASTAEDPVRECSHRELRQVLRSALTQIEPGMAEVLVKGFGLDGHVQTVAEISQTLKCSESKVLRTRRAAFGMMRGQLKRAGVTDC